MHRLVQASLCQVRRSECPPLSANDVGLQGLQEVLTRVRLCVAVWRQGTSGKRNCEMKTVLCSEKERDDGKEARDYGRVRQSSRVVEKWSGPAWVLSTTMKASTSTPSTSAPPTHSAFPPPSTASLARSSRIAPHSHIKALGLTPEGLATIDGAGFIGQNNAREVRVSFLGFFAPTLTNMTL